MSKFSSILRAVGLGAPKPPKLPDPVIAATPAPPPRDDVGGQVVIGTDAVNGNDRIGNSRKRKSGDVLGGLGQSSGLNI